MGLRRWVIFLLLVTVPLAGFGGAANLVSGPYDVSCANTGSGFQIVLTSLKTGETDSFGLPVGGCFG